MSDEQLDRIERWNLMLAIRLRDVLAHSRNARLSSPADRRFASAITTFAVNGKTGRQLQDALWAFTASPVHDDGERLLGTNGLKRAHLIIQQVRLSPPMTGRMKNGLHHTTKEGAIR